MEYIYPDYYDSFRCAADKCEDTCCAGWQICIDPRTMKRYKAYKGTFQRKLRRGIRFSDGTFRQDRARRCAFLDDQDLCRLITNIGEDALCRTCREYPRHTEVFENVREKTLSVSCPEVARMLMNREAPVRFLNRFTEREETDDEFDPLLYSKLTEIREAMLRMLQNRSLSAELRAALLYALAHDVQKRISDGQLFDCDEICERIENQAVVRHISARLATWKQNRQARYEQAQRLFAMLCGLERLRSEWDLLLAEAAERLYGWESRQVSPRRGVSRACEALAENRNWQAGNSKDTGNIGIKQTERAQEASLHDSAAGNGTDSAARYVRLDEAFDAWTVAYFPQWEIEQEQLLVYFISTYFCGAAYDGRAFAKAKFALFGLFCIRELAKAVWMRNEYTLDTEDVAELVYRFAREVEHSDENIRAIEHVVF